MTFILVYPIVVMVWLMCTACLCNVVIIDVNVNVNVNSRLLCGANRRVSKRIKLGFGVGFAIEDSICIRWGPASLSEWENSSRRWDVGLIKLSCLATAILAVAELL